ncbi:hypothetical protein [Ruegeria arenilitoris]|uniref:hypothetical protein n=1 Tax=Ruegeria arenilitoris TaxID=1173585 RepID=UPI0014817113|nr:hypothetical protein [Ruegeria arenilitoris]
MKLSAAHAICAEATTLAATTSTAGAADEGLSKATPDRPLLPSFRPTIGRVTKFLKVFSKTVDCPQRHLNTQSYRILQNATNAAVDLTLQARDTFQ